VQDVAPPQETELERQDRLWHAEVARTQSKWNTPESVISAWVRRATGLPLASLQRVMSGLSNEVYEVTLGSPTSTKSDAVFVRISHRDVPHFEQERWAIERCREAGVPVPTILLLEHSEHDGHPLSVCVERKIEGIPLGRVTRALGGEHPLSVHLLREAGTWLACIHTVPTDGHGPLDGNGRGPHATWDAAFLAFLDRPEPRERLERAAAHPAARSPSDARTNLVRSAVAVLRDHRAFLRGRPARLLHRDYEPWHLLVHDPGDLSAPDAPTLSPFSGARPLGLSGVLDLESCRGGDPSNDLVQWHAVHDGYAPVAPVVAGYREAGTWTPDFERGLHLGLLRSRLGNFIDAHHDPAYPGVSKPSDAALLLEHALAYFS
jgi:aminoglycoside phosphotransferase (APT) family kinase protein